MKVVTTSGNIVDAAPYNAADNLVKLRNTKSLWEVIDEVIKVWEKTKVHKYTAHLIDITDVKQSRDNHYASTASKSLRYLVDIPEDIIRMIRILYTVEELPMDKDFFKIFWKRYPVYRVSERL